MKRMDVWVTRDGVGGEEPDMLFLHGSKPEQREDGTWVGTKTEECLAIPKLARGVKYRLRLEVPA